MAFSLFPNLPPNLTNFFSISILASGGAAAAVAEEEAKEEAKEESDEDMGFGLFD